MNIEHRTSNIERRYECILSVLKPDFREAIPSFVIRYSNIR